MTLDHAAEFTISVLPHMKGGEVNGSGLTIQFRVWVQIFAPLAPSFLVSSLIDAVAPTCQVVTCGFDQGLVSFPTGHYERSTAGAAMHQSLLLPDEAANARLMSDRVVVSTQAPQAARI